MDLRWGINTRNLTTRYAIGIQLWHYRCRATLKIPHQLIVYLAPHFPLSLLVLIFREKVYEFLAKTNKHKPEKYLTIYNFSLYAGYQIFVSVHSSVSLEKCSIPASSLCLARPVQDYCFFCRYILLLSLYVFVFFPIPQNLCTIDFNFELL